MNKGYILMDALLIVVLVMIVSMLVLSSSEKDMRYDDVRLEYELKEKERVEEYRRLKRCDECVIRGLF